MFEDKNLLKDADVIFIVYLVKCSGKKKFANHFSLLLISTMYIQTLMDVPGMSSNYLGLRDLKIDRD